MLTYYRLLIKIVSQKCFRVTIFKERKASLPFSHCDPVKPVGHSHFSEIPLHVLLFSHLTQLQLKD